MLHGHQSSVLVSDFTQRVNTGGGCRADPDQQATCG